jgi:hypothetical protein
MRSYFVKQAKESLTFQSNASDLWTTIASGSITSQDPQRMRGVEWKWGSAMGATATDRGPSDSKNAKIMSMKRGPNWDGEGALAITEATCRIAVHFGQLVDARSLRAPSWIAPSTTGAIGFTWRTPENQLNVQVLSVGRTGCIVRRSGTQGRYQRKCSVNAAVEELSEFLAMD